MSGSCSFYAPSESFRALPRSGVLRDLDLHLVAAVARTHHIPPAASQAGGLALALAGRVVDDGHVCLDLDAVTEAWLVAAHPGPEGALPAPDPSIVLLCRQIADPAARAQLFAGWERGVGGPEDPTPFVLQGSRLYLRRMFDYERNVARRLRAMAGDATPPPVSAALDAQIAALLEDEHQRRAARMALTRRLTIISGGPGTGKTHTVARILALFSRLPGGEKLRVRLAAPTGKAAARMGESIRLARQQAAGAFHDGMVIEEACTLERLLGFQAGSPYFRHDAANPIEADLLLIDEASMVDLAKMSKLLDALGPATRLVLLGDMHQLASVQPGSVLAEIAESAALQECVAELRVSRRFPPGSAIDRLSRAINSAESEQEARDAWGAIGAAADAGHCTVVTQEVPAQLAVRGCVDPSFAQSVRAGYRDLLAAETPAAAFAALARFRILCAMRTGPHGVVTVNALVEEVLSRRDPAGVPGVAPARTLHPEGEFYSHRVILVTRNDYAISLFNGDVGIILPDDDGGGALAAYFPAAQGGATHRKIPCRLLPAHETAFAMTVHKAQGSEFESVLVILPHADAPVLTRELVYTAITRASRQVDLRGPRDAFVRAVTRRLTRFTALRAQLDAAPGAGEKVAGGRGG